MAIRCVLILQEIFIRTAYSNKFGLAQLVSGYPDARTDDVDAIINLLNTRTSEFYLQFS